jgi:glutamate synthase (NADPH/NADH) small chain
MVEPTLKKDDAVVSLLERRHVLDKDIKQVIKHAEETGEKLYQPDGDRFLAKATLSEATFYVEYSISGESFVIHTAYTHRSKIVEGD